MTCEIEVDLTQLPHSEISGVLRFGAPVYLLVNPIEFHGPHLPLKNDHLLSLAVAREIHHNLCEKLKQDWPFVLAAPMHAGVGPVPGAGSVAVSYLALKKLVIETCRSLEKLGASRVVVMTFHGDPLHNLALDAAVRDLHRRGIQAIAPFNALMNELLMYRPGQLARGFEPVVDPSVRHQLEVNMTGDLHAGFFETSLMLHFWPECVSPTYRDLLPCPAHQPSKVFSALSRIFLNLGFEKLAAELDLIAIGMAWLKLKECPGYTSSPHLANAASGKAFAEEVVRLFSEASELAFTEVGHSPEPILKWSTRVSLNGRVQL